MAKRTAISMDSKADNGVKLVLNVWKLLNMKTNFSPIDDDEENTVEKNNLILGSQIIRNKEIIAITTARMK